MSNPHSAPRRVSLGYILGFGDKPFKDPKPPPPPPRPKKPSQLTELISSPGGIVEWTASDGRKGKLTGTGKPRLTAASLAKVPSDTKGASKKSASHKHADSWGNTRDFSDWRPMQEDGASKKSGSKRAPSNKDDAWRDWQGTANGTHKGSQKGAEDIAAAWGTVNANNTQGPQADATGGETKKDERNDTLATEQAAKNETANESPVPGTTTPGNGGIKKPDDSNTWTKEQDDKMTQMKAENDHTPWAAVAENVGKPVDQCKARWKIIKPSSSKSDGEKKGVGKGGADEKSNSKNNNQKNNDGAKESKNIEEKEEKDADNPCGGVFNCFMGGDSDSKQEESKEANVSKSWDAVGASGWDAGATNNNDTGDADNCANSWGNCDGTGDSNDKDNGVAWDHWPAAAKPASAPRSAKAPSVSRSHCSTTSKSKPGANGPAEIELEPDDTFSADDLRLIARILQQDCSLVWNRVSWRFRDKTGRTLHPDVFEKKVTGTVEGKGDGGER